MIHCLEEEETFYSVLEGIGEKSMRELEHGDLRLKCEDEEFD